MDDIRAVVRCFIIDKIAGDDDLSSLSDDAQLRESGILDSLSTLKLVTFLEQRFGVRVDSQDLSTGSLASLASIERMVKSRSVSSS